MANAIPPRRPLRKPKAEHLCMAFPRLPDPDKKNFWLAAYLIDLAHCVALEGLATKLEAIGAPKSDQVTRSATYMAATLTQEKARKSAKYTQEDGMLLYAWPRPAPHIPRCSAARMRSRSGGGRRPRAPSRRLRPGRGSRWPARTGQVASAAVSRGTAGSLVLRDRVEERGAWPGVEQHAVFLRVFRGFARLLLRERRRHVGG